MTLTERPDGTLLIRRLPLEELALLSLAIPWTEDCRRVLDALLEGRRVALLPDACEHRAYRKTAPRGVYQKFVAMERELHALGVARARREETEGDGGCWSAW